MKHTPDQDLLMLAHRSLGVVPSLGARLHMARCAQCQRRYAEMSRFSAGVASAVRVGLPLWKPLGMALHVKLLLMAGLSATLLLGAEVVVSSRGPSPGSAVISNSAGPEKCETNMRVSSPLVHKAPAQNYTPK